MPARPPRTLAVVTHYRYERWLGDSIESLLRQSRPVDGIVVLDDASPTPPADVVRRYPEVTLLTAERNGGPYPMLRAVFEGAAYDAFLLQDADDWSAPGRHATLLAAAIATGAEMVGSQVTSVYDGIPGEPEVEYPADARAAVLREPTFHPVLMSTSLLWRDLVTRVGGLSAGLRFGADSEFIRRAIFAGVVCNVPERCYFRRVHPRALTRAPETGYGSPARQAVQARLQERARQNVARVLAGLPPDLRPIEAGTPARLRHVCGPPLRLDRRSPTAHAPG